MLEGIEGIAILVVAAIVFYFGSIRPAKMKANKREEMIEELRKGDVVVTLGGVVGEVTKADEKVIGLKIAENCEITVIRSAIKYIAGEEDV